MNDVIKGISQFTVLNCPRGSEKGGMRKSKLYETGIKFSLSEKKRKKRREIIETSIEVSPLHDYHVGYISFPTNKAIPHSQNTSK